MYLRRVQKNKLPNVFALYYSAVIYMIGSFLGSILSYQLTTFVSYDLFQSEPLHRIVQSLLYHGLMIYSATTAFGVLLIPMVLLVRGFLLSITIAAAVRWSGMTMLQMVLNLVLPSGLQVFTLFYLASVCYVLSQNRMRHMAIKREQLTQLKGAITLAIISSVGCAVLSLFA